MSHFSIFGNKGAQAGKSGAKGNSNEGAVKNNSQSPFSEAELTAFYKDLELAYRTMANANWDVSPYVCPPEMPVFQIKAPEDILRLCRMSRNKAYESFLELYDTFPDGYYRNKAATAISMYAYEKIGVQIPPAIADHISHAIGNIDASDAVEIIRDRQLFDYDYQRADLNKTYSVMPNQLRKQQPVKQQPSPQQPPPAQQTAPRPQVSTSVAKPEINDNRETIIAIIGSVWRRYIDQIPQDKDVFYHFVDEAISLKAHSYSKAELDVLRSDMVDELKEWVYCRCKRYFSKSEIETICAAKRNGKLEKDVNKNIYLLIGKGISTLITGTNIDFYEEYLSGRLIPYMEIKYLRKYKSPEHGSEGNK